MKDVDLRLDAVLPYGEVARLLTGTVVRTHQADASQYCELHQ